MLSMGSTTVDEVIGPCAVIRGFSHQAAVLSGSCWGFLGSGFLSWAPPIRGSLDADQRARPGFHRARAQARRFQFEIHRGREPVRGAKLVDGVGGWVLRLLAPLARLFLLL